MRHKFLKPEALFESQLATLAPNYKCDYVKIKDTRAINAENRYRHKEVQRIADAILMTETDNWIVECKMNYGELRPHQESLRVKSWQRNGKFVVLRKMTKLKGGIEYRIITKWGTWKTDRIEEIFTFLAEGIKSHF